MNAPPSALDPRPGWSATFQTASPAPAPWVLCKSGERAGTSRCVLVCTLTKTVTEGKMDLPFHDRLAYSCVHRGHASPLALSKVDRRSAASCKRRSCGRNPLGERGGVHRGGDS